MKHAFIVLLYIIGSSLFFSCKKDKDKDAPFVPDPNCNYVSSGRFISNPYNVDQVKTLTGIQSLEATHIYVKTFVRNSEELEKLGELGDFLPFDWRKEPNKNLSHDIQSSSEGLWMYGTIPVEKKNMIRQFESLDESYFPQTGDEVWKKMNPENLSHAKTKPINANGQVTFYDPIDGVSKPLKDITVIIRDGGKIYQVVTDQSGYFRFNNKIQSERAEVLLKFESSTVEIRTLNMDNLGVILTPNVLSFGMMGQCAFNQLRLDIGVNTVSNDLYNSAAAYFSYQQFRDFASANGYGIPEKKLNLWIARDVEFSTGYAAPMLRHVGSGQGTKELLMNLFNIPANLANGLANLIKNDLPDVYAPYESDDNDRESPYHIETMYHEFGHVTQYTRSGKEFWSDYIEHIFNNGGYGNGGGSVPGLVAMSEAWAEDFSLEMLSQVYGATLYPHDLRDRNSWGGYNWIPVGVYYDLLDEEKNEVFDNVGGFTFPELYQVFGPEVRTPQQFRDQLFIKYPAKAEPQRVAIFNLFSQYGYN